MTTGNLPMTISSTYLPEESTSREAITVAASVIRTLFMHFPQLSEMNADRHAMVTEWARGLFDMRPDEISRGLAACRMRKFPPSLGEFAQLCRPSLDPEIAWHEAQAGLGARARGEVGEWSHPAVWRAASEMSYEVRTGSLRQHRARWEWILSREFARGWVDDVPAPPARIEHASGPGVRPEAIRKRLAELARELSGKAS